MSALPSGQIIPFNQFEQLREARSIIQQEARALQQLAGQLDAGFCDAVELLQNCTGNVIVTGIGKAGLIGQKLQATFASTGTRAYFLHPSEAIHGDVGSVHQEDVVLALSNSGETAELCRVLPIIKKLGASLIAMTASDSSTLARWADVTVTMGKHPEAGPHGLAPSSSTTVMLALGDALALVLCRLRGFSPEQFAIYHPGGSLGKKLKTVREVMRQGDELRIASPQSTIREVLTELQRPGRRTGAVMLVDDAKCLAGIFTDSDLVRLLERHREDQLDRPVGEVMTVNPLTISPEANLLTAIDLLSEKKVSELPVVDDDGRPLGLIDITDVIAA